MALSLYSLVNNEVIVKDPDVVSKSWPSFFADMSAILSVEDVQN
jgi:5-enolpyruvylshikimate-3-phosphate synthase